MSDYEKGLRSLTRDIADAVAIPITDCRAAVMLVLEAEIVPLLDAVQKTIEFYDAHGGPMGTLREQINKWK